MTVTDTLYKRQNEVLEATFRNSSFIVHALVIHDTIRYNYGENPLTSLLHLQRMLKGAKWQSVGGERQPTPKN